MISKTGNLSVRHQCDLLDLHRSAYTYLPVLKDDTEIANRIHELYVRYPVYGYRRITACLRRSGMTVNHKRILRLMRDMGICAIYPGPKTTVSNASHKKHPYLLRGMGITRPHQVWQVDITYLRTNHGFMYMNALIDVYSRFIVGWSLSNTLDAQSCLHTFQHATLNYGMPDIMNSDQGCQFTGSLWIETLQNSGVLISMSGRGRSNDNAYIERLWRTLKYEWTIIKGARHVSDYKKLLPQFVEWYNYDRPHQSLSYKTPGEVLDQQSNDMLIKNMNKHHLIIGKQNAKDSLILIP
jgi:putative transposase